MQSDEQLADTGIHVLPVPTPFAVGAINAYLLEGDPLTLVDTGPNQATALDELERLIGATGYRLEDIEVVLLTHHHVDHEGLASAVAGRSGAEICCLDVTADFVGEFHRAQAADDDYAADLMLRHGIAPDIVDALRAVADLVQAFGAPVTSARRVSDGSVVGVGGRALVAMHRPGHSPSDTVFHDDVAGVLFAGDHLLSDISANALVTRRLSDDGGGVRMRPLLEYRASLAATYELDLRVVLGGHGPPIVDHRALIDRRLAEQDERAEHLLEILRTGRKSAHELAIAIWGTVAITQAYLTLSEVIGHLDLLLDAGAVAEDDTGETVYFEAL